MAESSKIEWTDHTASPWYGCAHRVLPDGTEHPGCAHCYAETMSGRNPGTLGIWGEGGTRVKSKSFIGNLRKWNREAAAAGKVVSVFPSLCDPFEDRPELVPWREEMLSVIDECPNVRLLLLTKRPENVRRMWTNTSRIWLQKPEDHGPRNPWWRGNVAIGTSISDQKTADELLWRLRSLGDLCPICFVSYEPAIGPVRNGGYCHDCGTHASVDGRCCCATKGSLDWWIVGGESGHHARPMHPQWARDIRDQCVAAGVPFFFKQWGEWLPQCENPFQPSKYGFIHRNGTFYRDLPDDVMASDISGVGWVGKKAAGRLLDGREWNELPAAFTATSK